MIEFKRAEGFWKVTLREWKLTLDILALAGDVVSCTKERH